MLPNLNEGGLLSHAYHFAKSGEIESRKNGKPEPSYKIVMGLALIFIGAQMTLDAWNKMHGGKGPFR